MQAFAVNGRSVSFRFLPHVVAGGPEPLPAVGRAVAAVTAAEPAALAQAPLILIDTTQRRAYVQPRAITALSRQLLPPPRPASLGFGLSLAVASLAWAPFAIGAAAYVALHLASRFHTRRMIEFQIESHLIEQVAAELPGLNIPPTAVSGFAVGAAARAMRR